MPNKRVYSIIIFGFFPHPVFGHVISYFPTLLVYLALLILLFHPTPLFAPIIFEIYIQYPPYSFNWHLRVLMKEYMFLISGGLGTSWYPNNSNNSQQCYYAQPKNFVKTPGCKWMDSTTTKSSTQWSGLVGFYVLIINVAKVKRLLKFDNLQYNTLAHWVVCLIDQVSEGPSII